MLERRIALDTTELVLVQLEGALRVVEHGKLLLVLWVLLGRRLLETVLAHRLGLLCWRWGFGDLLVEIVHRVGLLRRFYFL